MFRIIDFETTGMPDTLVKAICEVGWTDILPSSTELRPIAHLIDPGHPIPPEARAIHHIADADVAGCPSPTDACLMLMDGMPEDGIFVAHNAEFEQAFFAGGDHRWICTYKCALRAWPDAPAHTNQALRYWLGVNLDHALAMPPHRAGPDAYVTAHILRELLQNHSSEELLQWSREPTLPVRINFGKHKGARWSDLDEGYLNWIVNKADRLSADDKRVAAYYLSLKS